ncbi:hypothetical protein DPMN_036076 [Dreissena polymorpha]|uniref:Uncharacterized protein n=1 Tax=Dreissena polymorpha TaxID=45954 RepID=A0A9D4MAB1_DREPO|nr:hypothetical protein DPMN_036076 [Dreissena polymorpha]
MAIYGVRGDDQKKSGPRKKRLRIVGVGNLINYTKWHPIRPHRQPQLRMIHLLDRALISPHTYNLSQRRNCILTSGSPTEPERRRKLVPYLIQARKDGQQASLSYDTLYVDCIKYTHDHPPLGPVLEMPNHGPRNNIRRVTGSRGTNQPRTN